MRLLSDHINQYRIRIGDWKSDDSYGLVGAFLIPLPCGLKSKVICGDGMGWEHVSVSTMKRCLTWEEMCWVKDLFWNDDEQVIQIHPAKSEYISNHPYCLHLWRPTNFKLQLPPSILVGVK